MALRQDPRLSRNAVREAPRFGFDSAAAGSPRFALQDFELHVTKARKGQIQVLNAASAHRDESVFPDADRFDISRDTKDLLVFGKGPHYCLGANLAIQEMGCMVDAFIDFLPEGASLASGDIEWETTGLMRRPVNLPVGF
jgi:cytochrome P450